MGDEYSLYTILLYSDHDDVDLIGVGDDHSLCQDFYTLEILHYITNMFMF